MTSVYVVDLPSLLGESFSLPEILEMLASARRARGFEFFIPEDVLKEFVVRLLDKSEGRELVERFSEVVTAVEPQGREVKVPASTLVEYVKRLAEKFERCQDEVEEKASEELLGLEVALLAYELQARVISCRRSTIEACEILGVPCIGVEELKAVIEGKT